MQKRAEKQKNATKQETCKTLCLFFFLVFVCDSHVDVLLIVISCYFPFGKRFLILLILFFVVAMLVYVAFLLSICQFSHCTVIVFLRWKDMESLIESLIPGADSPPGSARSPGHQPSRNAPCACACGPRCWGGGRGVDPISQGRGTQMAVSQDRGAPK